MIRIIALTQFVFLALGTFALIVLAKTEANHGEVDQQLRAFLSYKGYWIVVVPILYVVIAEIVQRATAHKTAVYVLQTGGVLLAAAILVVYGWLILSF